MVFFAYKLLICLELISQNMKHNALRDIKA